MQSTGICHPSRRLASFTRTDCVALLYRTMHFACVLPTEISPNSLDWDINGEPTTEHCCPKKADNNCKQIKTAMSSRRRCGLRWYDKTIVLRPEKEAHQAFNTIRHAGLHESFKITEKKKRTLTTTLNETNDAFLCPFGAAPPSRYMVKDDKFTIIREMCRRFFMSLSQQFRGVCAPTIDWWLRSFASSAAEIKPNFRNCLRSHLDAARLMWSGDLSSSSARADKEWWHTTKQSSNGTKSICSRLCLRTTPKMCIFLRQCVLNVYGPNFRKFFRLLFVRSL